MSKKENKVSGFGYTLVSPQKLRAHPANEKYFGGNSSRYPELFDSIKTNGFLNQYPLTCTKNGQNALIIICGHRRWKVACEQDIPKIPIIVRHDIAADSIEAEEFMIEDNLQRPLQWRAFSDLELYVLAIKLKDLYSKKRGGDRRSKLYLASKEESENSVSNDIAEVVGISKRYMSMLSVSISGILKGISETSAALLEGKSLYDQIKTAVDSNLSEDLTGLAQSKVPIYKVYKKYKGKNNKSKTLTFDNEMQVTNNKIEEHGTFDNVVASLLRFLESQFDDREVFSEAAHILSEIPEGKQKKIKLLHKAVNSVLKEMSNAKTRKRKLIVEPELFPAEKMSLQRG
ncbi:MAG: ParB N-terminal domain-containing protein [Nitrospiraceae bacterium]|nr:ParB N-terminal domain-containing protein [Nitrospiraceae bacterium]